MGKCGRRVVDLVRDVVRVPVGWPPDPGFRIVDSRLLTVAEAARYLRVRRTYVSALIRRGELVAFRLGGRTRISPQALEAYLATCVMAPGCADTASRPGALPACRQWF